jgi:hypothetical protein
MGVELCAVSIAWGIAELCTVRDVIAILASADQALGVEAAVLIDGVESGLAFI